MDISLLKAKRRFRKGMRLVGVFFTVIGGIMVYPFVNLLLDPEATILFNGVPTNEYSVKLGAVILVGFFVLIGLFFALIPKRFLDKLFVLKMSLIAAFSLKK